MASILEPNNLQKLADLNNFSRTLLNPKHGRKQKIHPCKCDIFRTAKRLQYLSPMRSANFARYKKSLNNSKFQAKQQDFSPANLQEFETSQKRSQPNGRNANTRSKISTIIYRKQKIRHCKSEFLKNAEQLQYLSPTTSKYFPD